MGYADHERKVIVALGETSFREKNGGRKQT